MVTSILLKFLTLKWNISRTIWRIEVSDGSFFFIFHALSFELNFFRPEVPFKPIFHQVESRVLISFHTYSLLTASRSEKRKFHCMQKISVEDGVFMHVMGKQEVFTSNMIDS